jgi:hypothetical protein
MNRVVVAAFVLAVSATAAWAQPGTEAQAPTALAQFQSGGTTTLAPDGTALSTTAVFSAVMHGTDTTPATPEHKIRVEVRPMGTAFINVFTDEASTTVVSFEANGGDALAATSSVTVTGLVPGQQYHWQAMSFKT